MNGRSLIELIVAACTVIFLSVVALNRQEPAAQITVARSPYLPDSAQILPLEQLRTLAGERLQEFGVSGRAEREEISLLTFGQLLTLTGHHVNFDLIPYVRDDAVYVYKGYGDYGWSTGFGNKSDRFTEVLVALFAETGELREMKIYTPQGAKLLVDVNIEDTREALTPSTPSPRATAKP